MDPVTTTLVSAFVIGAAAGVKKVGESAVVDAYAGLKHLVLAGYTRAAALVDSITSLEKNPESEGRKQVVAEELKSAGAIDDAELLKAAEAVIAAAEREGHTQTIGVDWQDVTAARLTIGEIRARAGAIGFRAARMEITGEIEIPKIDAGGDAGK